MRLTIHYLCLWNLIALFNTVNKYLLPPHHTPLWSLISGSSRPWPSNLTLILPLNSVPNQPSIHGQSRILVVWLLSPFLPHSWNLHTEFGKTIQKWCGRISSLSIGRPLKYWVISTLNKMESQTYFINLESKQDGPFQLFWFPWLVPAIQRKSSMRDGALLVCKGNLVFYSLFLFQTDQHLKKIKASTFLKGKQDNFCHSPKVGPKSTLAVTISSNFLRSCTWSQINL
jgi:hypothetical protein